VTACVPMLFRHLDRESEGDNAVVVWPSSAGGLTCLPDHERRSALGTVFGVGDLDLATCGSAPQGVEEDHAPSVRRYASRACARKFLVRVTISRCQ